MAQGLSRDINRIQIAFLLRALRALALRAGVGYRPDGTILAAILAEYVFLSRPLTGPNRGLFIYYFIFN